MKSLGWETENQKKVPDPVFYVPLCMNVVLPNHDDMTTQQHQTVSE